MSNEAAVLKIPQDIEYRVLGNAFGLLISMGGLLVGNMVAERSLAYWQDDIVPLLLCAFMVFRLFRNMMSTMILYNETAPPPGHPTAATRRENVASEPLAMPQLPQVPGLTPEQVVEEVVKRIEVQKAEQARKAEKKATN